MIRVPAALFIFSLAVLWLGAPSSVVAADGAIPAERIGARPWWCHVLGVFAVEPEACRETPKAIVSDIPEDDKEAWKFDAPEPEPDPPPPPAPLPAAPVVFPPVIIEKTVVMEPPAVAEPPAVVETPPPPPPAPPPDWARIAAEASYARRAATPFAWSAPVAPGRVGPSAPPSPLAVPEVPGLPAPPKALAGYGAPSRTSGLPVDNERILTTDRYLTGILETSINSQLAGDGDGQDVVIQVNRDVFGYHGRSILIPKGSRLVCGFRAPKPGESRLGLNCGRVLLGGSRAEIWQATAGGSDVQGRRGVTGEVDRRFSEKYGTALILAGISGAVRAASAAVPEDRRGTDIAGEGAQELGERFGEITAAVLEETVDLAPIVTLPQGTRLVLKPARDWHIRRPGEPAPTEEGEGDAEG